MPVAFNHTIVQARDAQESAAFFSEIMGLPAPRRFGPFLAVPVEHGAAFDFAQVADDEPVHPQHYAFLVTEADFDDIYGRIVERGIEHYPEPHFGRTNEINHNDGGRGVYTSGHFLEILTVPYGGWPPGSVHQRRVEAAEFGWGQPVLERGESLVEPAHSATLAHGRVVAEAAVLEPLRQGRGQADVDNCHLALQLSACMPAPAASTTRR